VSSSCFRLVFPAVLAELEIVTRNAQHSSSPALVPIAGSNDPLQDVFFDDRSRLPERELLLLFHEHHHLFEFEPSFLMKQLCVGEVEGSPETSLELGDILAPGIYAEEVGKKDRVIRRERGKPQGPFAIIGSKEGDIFGAFA
jgi:hypothetical protein